MGYWEEKQQYREQLEEEARERIEEEDERNFCGRCGISIKKDVFGRCVICNEFVCKNCAIKCKKCSKVVCKDCTANNPKFCKHCGKDICGFCDNEDMGQICNSCHKNICEEHFGGRTLGSFFTPAQYYCKKCVISKGISVETKREKSL